MRIDIVTIFPEYFAPLDLSLLGRARARGLVRIDVHDLRRWTDDPHRTVDDAPFGGGPGMVMRPEPWGAALDELVPAPPAPSSPAVPPTAAASGPSDRPERVPPPLLVVPTPGGQPFRQSLAEELARESWLIFACGRYEGIDSRVTEDAGARMPVLELSVGDYVLAGGEAAALVVVEVVTRLLPGVVGNAASVAEDSFAAGSDGILAAPVYTRPAVWRGRAVPEVLRSGDHAAIARWRREQARLRTARHRPHLLSGELPPNSAGVAQ